MHFKEAYRISSILSVKLITAKINYDKSEQLDQL